MTFYFENPGSSYAEAMNELGLNSKATVKNHVDYWIEAGRLQRTENGVMPA